MSISKKAVVLLCTLTSTCEAMWNVQEIQNLVQVPYWLGTSQQAFLQVPFSQEWMPVSSDTKTVKAEQLRICCVYPLNSCNANWFAEDLEWSQRPHGIPKAVKAFLRTSVNHHFGVDVMEIFSPPRVTKEAELQNRAGHQPTWRVGLALDLTTGYDFTCPRTRHRILRMLDQWRPCLVILSPPCTSFTPLRNLSNYKRAPEVVAAEEQEGDLLWDYALDVAEEQYWAMRAFLLEHPKLAKSWKKPRTVRFLQRPGIYVIYVDMCAYQLRTKEGMPAKKPTLLVTNCYTLAKMLHKRCPGDHEHRSLLGGRAAAAAEYTRPFVRAILRALRKHMESHGVMFLNSCESATSPLQPEPEPEPVLSSSLFEAVDAEARAITQPLAQYALHESAFQLEYQLFLQQCFPSQRILGGDGGRLPTLRRQPLPTIEEGATGSSSVDPVMENVKNQLRPIAESDQLQQQALDMRERTRKDGKLTISGDLRREVFRLHRNLGHPD